MPFDPVFPIWKVECGDCKNCGRPLDPASSWLLVHPEFGPAGYCCSYVCLEDQRAEMGLEP